MLGVISVRVRVVVFRCQIQQIITSDQKRISEIYNGVT